MIGRVTQQGITSTSLRLLQGSLGRTSTLQQQLSSGKAIAKPSDDPAGLVDALRIRSDQRANAQYARNSADGIAWLTTVDTALSTSSTLLINARNLVVQGASTGSLSKSAREAIAIELESLSDAMLEQANTTYLGRPVFAGSADASAGFTTSPDTDADGIPEFSWNGTAGAASVSRRVSENELVPVDSDGSAVFGDGTASGTETVFHTLRAAAAAVRSGDSAATADFLTTIDTHHDALLKEIGSVGSRYNQIETAQARLIAAKATLQAQRSDVEDVDLAETIVELQVQQVAYQAALGATQQALQPSLLDFLR